MMLTDDQCAEIQGELAKNGDFCSFAAIRAIAEWQDAHPSQDFNYEKEFAKGFPDGKVASE